MPRHYEPLTKEAQDPAICHFCCERPIQYGLTFPNGVPCCRVCFDKYPSKKKAVIKRKTSKIA
jgi:hypothetical protein